MDFSDSIDNLPPGAKTIALELKPAFELFGIKPNFKNLFSTLKQLEIVILDVPDGSKLLSYFIEYVFVVYDKGTVIASSIC